MAQVHTAVRPSAHASAGLPRKLLEVLKCTVLDPLPIVWNVRIDGRVKYEGAEVRQRVDEFVEVRNVVRDVAQLRIQILQLLLEQPADAVHCRRHTVVVHERPRRSVRHRLHQNDGVPILRHPRARLTARSAPRRLSAALKNPSLRTGPSCRNRDERYNATIPFTAIQPWLVLPPSPSPAPKP